MSPWPAPPPEAVVYLNGLPAVGKQTMGQALAGILGADKAILIDSFTFTDHLELPPSLNQRKATPSPSPPTLSPLLIATPRAGAATTTTTATTNTSNPSSKAAMTSQAAATAAPPPPPSSGPTTPPPKEPRQSSRHRKRAECFARYVENTNFLTRVVIFTDSQLDTPEGEAEARAYEQAAKRAGRPFVPIYVTCKPDENLRRFNTVERRCSQKGRGLRVSPPASSSSSSSLLSGASGGIGRSGGSQGAAAIMGGGTRLYRFLDYAGLDVNATTQEAHVSAMQILPFVHWCVEVYRGERRGSRASLDVSSGSEGVTPIEGQEPEWKHLGAR